MERIYRLVVPKAKSEVGNHLKDIAVSFSHVVRRDALGYLGEDKQSFKFSIFYSHFTMHSFHRIWKNIVFEDLARLLVVPERF